MQSILLEETKNLFSWRKPFLPEDLMFIKDNFIKFSMTSHEEYSYIYCESEQEFEKIKEMGVEFYREYNNEEEKKIKQNSKKIVEVLLK